EHNGHLLGFRPEHFLPVDVISNEGEYVTFSYHVGRVENLGSDRLIYGTVDGAEENRTISKLPSTVRVTIEPDAPQEFAVLRRDLRFFDKKSGLRLESSPLELQAF